MWSGSDRGPYETILAPLLNVCMARFGQLRCGVFAPYPWLLQVRGVGAAWAPIRSFLILFLWLCVLSGAHPLDISCMGDSRRRWTPFCQVDGSVFNSHLCHFRKCPAAFSSFCVFWREQGLSCVELMVMIVMHGLHPALLIARHENDHHNVSGTPSLTLGTAKSVQSWMVSLENGRKKDHENVEN